MALQQGLAKKDQDEISQHISGKYTKTKQIHNVEVEGYRRYTSLKTNRHPLDQYDEEFAGITTPQPYSVLPQKFTGPRKGGRQLLQHSVEATPYELETQRVFRRLKGFAKCNKSKHITRFGSCSCGMVAVPMTRRSTSYFTVPSSFEPRGHYLDQIRSLILIHHAPVLMGGRISVGRGSSADLRSKVDCRQYKLQFSCFNYLPQVL